MKKGLEDAKGAILITVIVIACLILFAFALYNLDPGIFWFIR
jgi:preprotein translocase subunit SecE